jgi:hypothetical protein
MLKCETGITFLSAAIVTTDLSANGALTRFIAGCGLCEGALVPNSSFDLAEQSI